MRVYGRLFAATVLFFSVISVGLAPAALASTGAPLLLHHQGRLYDTSGNLLGGTGGTNYCFRFSLYDGVSGGTKLWPTGTPSTMTVDVTNGVFNVNIGDVAAGGDLLDFDFNSTDTAFLNVEVAAQVASSCSGVSFDSLAPRQQLTSSGYALNANAVAGYSAAQSATGNQIPVLTSGNLVLGGTNPQVNATGTNTLTFQSGVTGAVQFVSSANSLTSAGVLTLASNALVGAGAGLDTSAAGALAIGNTTATSVSLCNSAACDAITLGTNTDADTITIGDATNDTLTLNGATVAIDSGDWDISTTGVITGASFDANGTGNSISNIDNADLTNSTVTVTAGAGLISGGTIALGGSTTLNVASANGGIVANTDDIALTLAASADGLSATTSSGSGLEILASGLSLLQGCANNEILKWNEASDVWACAADSSGGGGGTLDDAYNNGGTVTVDAYDVLFNLNDATNDYKLTIDNTTAGAISTALAITSTGGGSSITTAVDLSATAIGTALALGSNDVTVGGATLSATELALLDGGVTNAELTDSGTLTATTVDINGGAIDGTAIGASATSTAAFTTLTSSGVTALGNNTATVAINSNDWDIDATGAITGVSFDANGTGNAISNIDNADLTNDTLDFDKFADALTLDAATSITGAAGKTLTLARTLTDATSETGTIFNYTASDTTSGTAAQYGLYLDNLASTEGLDASLVIDNSDADDVIGAAIKIVDAGGGFTTIIDDAGTLLSATELNVLDGGILLSELTNSGTLTATTVDINGGAIDGTAIGASSPSTGAFTTLATTGVTALGNNSATVAVNSNSWDISTGGTGTGLTLDGGSNTFTNLPGSALPADGLDFDKFADALTLDAATSITGAAGKTLTLARTLTDATSETGTTFNYTASDTTSGTTAQYGLYLDNLASTEGLDASLVIDNSDADDVIGAAIKIVDAGGGFTTIIDDAGTLLSAAELNRLDGKDAALVDTNDAVATAITGTGILTSGTISSTFGAIDVGADNIRTSGTVFGNAHDRTTAGALTIGATNATSITLGSSIVTALTVTTDGTGTAEVALPAGSIDGTEILDDTVALSTDTSGNYVATLTAGNGLTGSVSSEGSTPTLAVVSGNGGIVANADDITLTVAASADALSATTSSGSGLEVLSSGLALLQGCSDTQVLKWNEASDVWACSASGGGGASDLSSLTAATGDSSVLDSNNNTLNWNWDFTTAAVDAGLNITESSASTNGTQGQQTLVKLTTVSGSTASPLQVTSTSADVGDIFFNLASSGDLEIRDNGTAYATFDDAGGITFAPTGTSDLVLNEAAGVNFQVTATAAPTVNMAALTNAGQGTTTDGVNGLSIAFVTGDGTNPTNDGLKIAATSGGTGSGDILNGIELTLSGTSGTENGINFGTGWDSLIKGTTAGTNLLSFTNFNVTSAGAGTFGGASSLTLGTSSSATGAVIFKNSTNTNTATLQSGTTSSSYTWTLPAADAAGCLQSNGSGTLSLGTCGDVHTDLVAATGTWTKPAGALMVVVELWGGGGGGGGGAGGGTGTSEAGGGGGGGGAYMTNQFATSNLGSSVEVTIGSAGSAGTAGSSGAGGDGGVGGTTCFSTTTACAGTIYSTAYGGGGGYRGGTTALTGGGGGGGGQGGAGLTPTSQTGGAGGGPNGAAANTDAAGTGGAGGATATTAGSNAGGSSAFGGAGGGASSTNGSSGGTKGGGSLYGSGGGGGGGSCAVTTCTARGGAQGGDVNTIAIGGGGSASTVGGGGSGGNGNDGTDAGAQGGGGGANNSAGTGGAGGNGGVRGGGGGGGGAGETTTGGAGGSGGAGYARIFTYKGSGADLAEIYGTTDSSIAAGDVVALDPSLRAGVRKSTKPYDATTFGIVSTSPSLVMGSVEDNGATPVMVAMSGRAPVKVSLENGDILPGDLLTSSSTPGVAMKATKAGQVIGQAMTSYTSLIAQGNGTTQGLVLAFIKTDFYTGSSLRELVPGLESGEVPTLASNAQTLTALALKKQELVSSASLSEVVTDRVTAGLEVVTPKLLADEVVTNTLTPVENDLTIALGADGHVVFTSSADAIDGQPIAVVTIDAAGNATFTGTVTAANITNGQVDGLAPIQADIEILKAHDAAEDAQNALLLDRVTALENRPQLDISSLDLAGDLTIGGIATFAGGMRVDTVSAVGDRLTFLSDLLFIGRPYFNHDTGGFAVIHAGDTQVDIHFDQPYLAQPVVQASITFDASMASDSITPEQAQAAAIANEVAFLQSNAVFIVTNKSASGFTLWLSKPVPVDVHFSWLALAVQDARTSLSEPEALPLPPPPDLPVVIPEEPVLDANPVDNVTELDPAPDSAPVETPDAMPEPEPSLEPDPVTIDPDSTDTSATDPATTTPVDVAPAQEPEPDLQSTLPDTTVPEATAPETVEVDPTPPAPAPAPESTAPSADAGESPSGA